MLKYTDIVAIAKANNSLTSTVKSLSEFNVKKRHYGIIPKGLPKALMDLGFRKRSAKSLADELGIMSHKALADDHVMRAKIMANEREYGRHFRETESLMQDDPIEDADEGEEPHDEGSAAAHDPSAPEEA